jgi:hypothetical protein
MDSQFVCDYAKKVAINTCVSVEIYYKAAISSGISLSGAEEEIAQGEAKTVYGSMSREVLTRTGLDENIIVNMRIKQALASKYAKLLSESESFEGYSGDPEKLLNWDGAYYQENILPKHIVKNNEKILDKITLGKITVNYQ